MIELKGKYNKDCKVFVDEMEESCYPLVQDILDSKVSDGVSVRIMPDTHAGKGIVIGFTMPLTDMVNPDHVGVDIGCFVGDTKIPLLDGTQRTIKELVNTGEFYVYSYDIENGKIVGGKATAFKTRENAKLVKINISGGNEVICTLDHKFLMRNGEYKEAKDLKYLDSLMPLYRNYYNRDGYECIQQPNKSVKSIPTHRLIAMQYHGNISETEEVHHIDFNLFNNEPYNLVIMDRLEHQRLHGEIRGEKFKTEEFKKRRKEQLDKNGYYHPSLYNKKSDVAVRNISNYMENNPEHFANVAKANGQRGSDFFKAKNSDEVLSIRQKIGKYAKIINRVLTKYSVFSEEYYNDCRKGNEYLYTSYTAFCGEYALNPITDYGKFLDKQNIDEVFFNNHKVVSIEFLDYTEDVYCLNVEKYHNFALSAGVFVHNCGVITAKTKGIAHLLKQFDSETEVLQYIDHRIRKGIPMGMNYHTKTQGALDYKVLNSRVQSFYQKWLNKYDNYGCPTINEKYVTDLIKRIGINTDTFYKSIGTLGGGETIAIRIG